MLNRKGFTLVELMIVVAIIGILAAIAIPNFVSMQYKTKRAEIPSNLKGIKTAELAYESNFDVFVLAASYPGTPTKTVQQWVKASSGGFASMGWSPDGDARGTYDGPLLRSTLLQLASLRNTVTLSMQPMLPPSQRTQMLRPQAQTRLVST